MTLSCAAEGPIPHNDTNAPPRATMTRPRLALAAAPHSAVLAVLAVAALASLAACEGKSEPAATSAGSASGASASGAASGAGAAASAPPVSVSLVRAQVRDVAVTLDATGTVAPMASVDVRPQVTSVVTRVHIKEGQFVRAGEPLFTLDSRTDEANVAKVRAQMARDEAALADAQRTLQRSRELLAQNFISQGALDANQTVVESNAALVASDRAAVDAARVALSYARVTAPGAGRVGAINVFPGSAVQATQTTLVTITQLDPINVSFNLPQRSLGDALAALQGAGGEVVATLPEAGLQFKGRLQFVDNLVDAASGTVKVKAVFANKDYKLWPGAFANVRMTVRTIKDAVVVPQAAVIQSPRGTIVYIVGPENKAVPRPVTVVVGQGEDAVVTGLRGGERVVLDGRQNVRPGATVVERAREGGRGASGAASGGASGAGRGASGASGAGRGAGDGAAAATAGAATA